MANVAVSYYDHHGPDSLRMLAHFFRSVAYNNMALYRNALHDGLIAKDIADRLGHDYWTARACQEIANAYYSSHDMDATIRYSEIAINKFNKTGYFLNAQYIIIDKAMALTDKGDFSASINLLDSLCPLIDKTDFNITAYLEDAYMKPLIELGKLEDALHHAKRAISLEPYIIEPTTNYGDIADIYLKLNNPDSAMFWLEKAMHQLPNYYHKIYAEYLFKVGRHREAFNEQQIYYTCLNDIQNNLINNNISFEERDFAIYKSNEIISSKQHTILLIIVIASISFILAVCFIINLQSRNKIRRLQIEQKLNEANQIALELKHSNQSLSNKIFDISEERNRQDVMQAAQIEQLFKAQFSAINELYEKYFESKMKISAASSLSRKIEKQLAYISSDESILSMQETINKYKDNILIRLSQQIKLTTDDIRFITLIMAGFSTKTICILLKIEQPTFYTKRRRLRDKILQIQPKDAEEFMAIFTK